MILYMLLQFYHTRAIGQHTQTHTYSSIRQHHSQLAIDKKVLLVFPKNDIVRATLYDACNRLEMDTFMSKTVNETIEAFQHGTTGGHNLIIVDGRTPTTLDPETIAR